MRPADALALLLAFTLGASGMLAAVVACEALENGAVSSHALGAERGLAPPLGSPVDPEGARVDQMEAEVMR